MRAHNQTFAALRFQIFCEIIGPLFRRRKRPAQILNCFFWCGVEVINAILKNVTNAAVSTPPMVYTAPTRLISGRRRRKLSMTILLFIATDVNYKHGREKAFCDTDAMHVGSRRLMPRPNAKPQQHICKAFRFSSGVFFSPDTLAVYFLASYAV